MPWRTRCLLLLRVRCALRLSLSWSEVAPGVPPRVLRCWLWLRAGLGLLRHPSRTLRWLRAGLGLLRYPSRTLRWRPGLLRLRRFRLWLLPQLSHDLGHLLATCFGLLAQLGHLGFNRSVGRVEPYLECLNFALLRCETVVVARPHRVEPFAAEVDVLHHPFHRLCVVVDGGT